VLCLGKQKQKRFEATFDCVLFSSAHHANGCPSHLLAVCNMLPKSVYPGYIVISIFSNVPPTFRSQSSIIPHYLDEPFVIAVNNNILEEKTAEKEKIICIRLDSEVRS